MGSIPSELSYSYQAKEMENCVKQLVSVEGFRNAPYWKYTNVLSHSAVADIPLFDQTALKVHGKISTPT